MLLMKGSRIWYPMLGMRCCSFPLCFCSRLTRCTMDSLPVELSIRIFDLLPVKALFRCECVCRKWQQVVQDVLPKRRFLAVGDVTDDSLLFSEADVIRRIDDAAPMWASLKRVCPLGRSRSLLNQCDCR